MKQKRTETDIVRACLSWLVLRRIPAWRNNTGAIVQRYKNKSRLIRFGHRGMSDILGIMPPDGRFLAIECKTDRGKTTEYQEVFLREIRDAGGIAFVARGIDDLEEHLQAALAGKGKA